MLNQLEELADNIESSVEVRSQNANICSSLYNLTQKTLDDVLGGDDMWKHADSTAGPYISLHETFGRLCEQIMGFIQLRVQNVITAEHTFICCKFDPPTNL